MELLDGLDLQSLVERFGPVPPERAIYLVRQVCHSLAEAESYGLVHRDIKPANILVDGTGTPRLLDFGIAKLLEPGAGWANVPDTRSGFRWMTPEYAAPEQVRGKPITTATDVYQLGVVLYGLLCGRTPFDTTRNLHDLERAVLDRDPRPPSTALTERPEGGSRAEEDLMAVATARATRPDRLRRALRGDLDAIVLKALRKRPEERYASAQELADDIRRHLSGQAVTARRQTTAYRLRTFARRHRWGLAVAAGFLVVLSAYAVTATAQTQRIRRALARANLETAKAEQVTRFMIGLFEANDPGQALGDTVTARELLERGVARARRLDSQPEVQAQMLDAIGRIRTKLGAYAAARPVLEQALATRRRALGDRHPEVGESLHHLADLTYEAGDPARAASLYREALAVRRSALGSRHPRALASLFALGTAMHESGDAHASLALFEEWMSLQKGRPAMATADDADRLEALGAVFTYGGQEERAEPLLRRALELRRSLFGPEHPQVAVSLSDLGVLMERTGDVEAAEKLLRESLAVRRAIYPAGHPEVATGLTDLAATLWSRGDLDQAEALYRDALVLLRRGSGDEHAEAMHAERLLGSLLIEKGEAAEAEAFLRDALHKCVARFGDDYLLTALTRYRLGEALLARGAFDEAGPLLHASYDRYRERFGEGARQTRTIARSLVKLYEASGRPGDAAPYRRVASGS
jgi:serine/threonine-protein kinase